MSVGGHDSGMSLSQHQTSPAIVSSLSSSPIIRRSTTGVTGRIGTRPSTPATQEIVSPSGTLSRVPYSEFEILQQYNFNNHQQLQINQQFQELHNLSSSQLLDLQSNLMNRSNIHNHSTPLHGNNLDQLGEATSITTERNQYIYGASSQNHRGDETPTEATEAYTCPYGCCDTPGIPEYLLLNGLIRGNYYDVIIKAFNKKYKLHKLFLDRSPYFKSLFNWSSPFNRQRNTSRLRASNYSDSVPLNLCSDLNSDSDTNSEDESDCSYRKTYELIFDDLDDTNMASKRKSFELAISRLYGAANLKEEYKIPYDMIEMGQYLGLSDISCTATDFIVKNMDMSNLADNLRFAISSDYGTASQRIIENGKGILCSDGWEKGPDAWNTVPTSIISEVVGEDYFFVPTEWDRCMFIIKLIEVRLEKKNSSNKDDYVSSFDDVEPLKKVLNEKIHYCHIQPDKLQELENLLDINGNNYIEPHILHAALWQTVQLETMITRSSDSPHTDKIFTSCKPPSKHHNWFRIPSKDETLSGLPKELNILLENSFSTSANNQLNQNDTKTTQRNDFKSVNTYEEKTYNWTRIPPFRFSISFANVSQLPTDKRVYGKTFWYAGSYWNLYLQKSYIPQKNSYQIGVYLHRAHSSSSNSSGKTGTINPDIFAGNINYKTEPKRYDTKEHFTVLQSETTTTTATASIESLGSNRGGTTMVDQLGVNILDLSIDDSTTSLSFETSANVTKKQDSKKQSIISYEDQRNEIQVYFVIFTPSRRAVPTITSFLSVPNRFGKSQSWGWKSNNMCVFNEDGTFADGQDPNLKFMILLGNV